LDRDDIVVRDDGIRLTTVTRTIFDLARVLSEHSLESVMEQALHDGLTDQASLVAIGERLRQQGRNGSALYGRLLKERSPRLTPVDSDLELRVDRALRRAGIPCPERQWEFTLPSGRNLRVDFYWPEAAVVLEVDHPTWHSDRLSLERDKWRDRQLSLLDILTVRVTEWDVDNRLDRVVWEVGSIIRRRSGVVRG
jgi:hypothetical protein